SLFSKLSKVAGETIHAENFWRLPDTLRCEKQNFPDSFEQRTPWYSEELLEEMEALNTKINRFTSGLYASPEKPNRLDIGKEIRKLRCGPLISDIFGRMLQKLDCIYSQNRAGRSSGCSEKTWKMKYYAYSSHDMTLYSLLTAMGLEDLTSMEIGSWPSYASSLFVELFIRKQDKNPYFRVSYFFAQMRFVFFAVISSAFFYEVSTNTNDVVPKEMELIFVHTIWRHGDRSPDGHLNNDPVDPMRWIKGGGGYGQLTPEGMEQQFILGKKLRDLYVETGFLHNFYDSQQYIRITSQVSELFNNTFTWDNLWKVHDAVMIQLIHFPEAVHNQSWFSENFFEELEELERPSKAFVSGLYDPPIVKGINHDHTVYALLAILGLESIVDGPEKYGEWPDYASDILVELFHNSTDRSPYFRILYQKNINHTFEVITPQIKKCEHRQFCSLNVFEHYAKEFRPDRPIQEFCQTPPGEDNRIATWINNNLLRRTEPSSAS
ncbi:Protein CBG02310, partial [Caenorhabditis briggsae]